MTSGFRKDATREADDRAKSKGLQHLISGTPFARMSMEVVRFASEFVYEVSSRNKLLAGVQRDVLVEEIRR